MKFLVDAQLPRRLALAITTAGHDAIHTLDLPDANRSKDSQLNDISVTEERVVISKDSDFVDSFLLAGKPYKLLIISTGNISNKELEALFMPQLPAIIEAFQEASYLELTKTALIIHS
jgi:predicted nuclease of predicted toxin-antitoxin system